MDRASVDEIIGNWAKRPRLGATEMLAKEGLPQDATSARLIWRNPGPFKRISVMNLETPHDFPLPHGDFLEHALQFKPAAATTAAFSDSGPAPQGIVCRNTVKALGDRSGM